MSRNNGKAGIARAALDRVYPPRHAWFYLQRTVLEPARRQAIAQLISRFRPHSSAQHKSAAAESLALELEENGWCRLPNLMTTTEIARVKDFFADKLCYDRFRPFGGEFSLEEAPTECHVAVYRDADIIACPGLLQAANNPLVLASVEAFLGCKPTLSNLSVWWSLKGSSPPEDAELFHRDVDDWRFVKLFVYLTDVEPDSGPHTFVSGSHRVPRLLRIRRYRDEEVTRVFDRALMLAFAGPAGTSFLENTFGLHKGERSVASSRLLFQAQYSLMPIGTSVYTPARRSVTHKGLDHFVNRLYLSA
jgi:hypothetical protein